MSLARGLGFLQDFPVEVVVVLGRAKMTIRELASLTAEDVVELDRAAGDPVELVVGGKVIARGEMIVVKDRVALKILEVDGEPLERPTG